MIGTYVRNGIKLAKNYIIPDSVRGKSDSFRKEQMEALSEFDTLSKIIFHRSYTEEDVGGSNPIGLYKNGDGRYGAIFELTPPPYLSESIENLILSTLTLIVKDDTVVYINTFASRNISAELDRYKNIKNHNKGKKSNLRNPEIVDKFIDNQAEYFERWTRESIMGKDADMRVRNIRNTLSILFPYDCDMETIREQYFQILGTMQELGARAMPSEDFIPLAKEFVSPHLGRYEKSNDTVTKINKQIAKGAEISLSENNGTIYFGADKEWKAKVLTSDKFPPSIDLFTYQNAFFDVMGGDAQMHIPSSFMLSLTIRFTEVEKRKKEILDKAKHNYKHTDNLGRRIEKLLPDIKILKDESEHVIHWVTQMGEIPLEGKFDLIIFEESETKLNQSIGRIKKSFEAIPGRWILKEETFSTIALQIYIQSLPLNYSEIFQDNIKKMDLLFKSNNSQIAPLISDIKGLGNNPTHFYIGRTGQFVGIDFFASKQNYNIIIYGPQGSGKSVATNYIHLAGLAAKWDIRMIDFGRSYEKLCHNVGGQFLEFPKNNNMCLNFMTFINTNITQNENGEEIESIDADEYDTIVPIIGLMMGISLRSIYKQANSSEKDKLELSNISTFVRNALDDAFEMSGRNGGMREVGQAMIQKRDVLSMKESDQYGSSIELLTQMITALDPYTNPRGGFYKYYNGTNNIDIKSNYLIAELDDIADSPIMPVIAMGLLQRMAQEAFIEYLKDKSTARLIGVDEAWKVLDSPIFSSFLEDFARRIRKYRGITLIATQRAQDFFSANNQAAKTIFETASFKIALPQPSEMIESAIADKCINVSNRFEKNLMKSVAFKKPHYNEMYIKYSNASFIVAMKLTPDDYWTFTSDPSDREQIDNVMHNKNLELSDALWYLARKSEGIKEEEIKYLMSTRDKGKKTEEEWENFFRDILHDNAIYIAGQKIFNIKDKDNPIVSGEELFMRIKHKNTFHSNSYFKAAAQKHGYYIEISKRFMTKCFEYVDSSKSPEQVSINLDILEIKDVGFKDYLIESIENLGDCKKKLIFDVVLDYDTKENLEILLSFANEVKEHGVNIAFDNIDFGYLDIKTLLKINPKQYKINIEDLRVMIGEEAGLNYLKSLIFSLLSSNTENKAQTIFVKVESEDDVELANDFEVEYVQGYKYGKPEVII